MRISRDPILSKNFSDMTDAEQELAKIEINRIVRSLQEINYSPDFRQALAVSLFASNAGNLASEPVEPDGYKSDVFKDVPEPDPFEKRDLFGENFKKVALPKEPVRSDRSSLDAKRKESADDLKFAALAKELIGRSINDPEGRSS